MADKDSKRGGYRHGTPWNLNKDELVTIRVPRYLKARIQRIALEFHQAVQEHKRSQEHKNNIDVEENE